LHSGRQTAKHFRLAVWGSARKQISSECSDGYSVCVTALDHFVMARLHGGKPASRDTEQSELF